MKRFKSQWLKVCLLGAMLSLAAQAFAQSYPTKPVKLLIPYGPGGAVDMMGRTIGKAMQDLNGQPYIVENKGGAGGIIAANEVSRATPDGYTILFGATGQISIAPAVHGAKLGFDPLKDLIPVSLVATTPYVLVTTMGLPVNSVAELIEHGKKSKINFASAGNASADHLAGELFNKMAGLSSAHVPYKGAGQALGDLVAGHVQYEFVSPLPAMPLVEGNKLRLLAVTGRERSTAMPKVPTVAETVPGFEVTPWYGFFVPGNTPPAVVAKIASDLQKVIASDEVQQAFRKRGLDPTTNTPQEFAAFLRADLAKWAELAKSAGVKPE